MLDLNANVTADGTDAVLVVCMLGVICLALAAKHLAVRVAAIVILFAGFGSVLMAPLLAGTDEDAAAGQVEVRQGPAKLQPVGASAPPLPGITQMPGP